jgi:hypothetical protein
MHTDSLIQLSRAINAAFEAAVVPALILLGAALVIMAAAEIRAHVRRRQRRAARKVANGSTNSCGATARG